MTTQTTTYMLAIRDGIAEEMRRDPTIILLGEGIGERGGSYGHTKNLWQEFGGDRVLDTPISENGFMGLAVGAAAAGLHPIVDLMFADLLLETMSLLCHQAAKIAYLSNGQYSVPLVVRAQMGGRTTGAHHSGCLYPLCMHVPGLKVVAPATPRDAKGLIKAALRDRNPVVFFDHKFAYAEKGEVPVGEYAVPIGPAEVVRAGRDVTVVAVSTMVGKTLKALAGGLIGADVELVDPRTLYPLDLATILGSVRKTGRLVIAEEAHLTCGAGAEIAAQAAEHAFGALKAPIVRVATQDLPHPFSPPLEKAMAPDEQAIAAAIERVLDG